MPLFFAPKTVPPTGTTVVEEDARVAHVVTEVYPLQPSPLQGPPAKKQRTDADVALNDADAESDDAKEKSS
eukprot:COSAG02_NODE_273_length_26316_cov_13.661060_11_plen_71_part_00